ncbi:hypothetical protein SESBI_40197 [Sesbania bispinosa]|nr:hypothetical protein SESBI_40197 [Sesbania bispinosa]
MAGRGDDSGAKASVNRDVSQPSVDQTVDQMVIVDPTLTPEDVHGEWLNVMRRRRGKTTTKAQRSQGDQVADKSAKTNFPSWKMIFLRPWWNQLDPLIKTLQMSPNSSTARKDLGWPKIIASVLSNLLPIQLKPKLSQRNGERYWAKGLMFRYAYSNQGQTTPFLDEDGMVLGPLHPDTKSSHEPTDRGGTSSGSEACGEENIVATRGIRETVGCLD